MSKKAKKKAARKAEEERKMVEQEERDSLEVLLEEAQQAAVEIRGARDYTTRDLQRILADDILGTTILLGQEFGERDEDHEVRLRRLEALLGLGDVTEEEYAALLEGSYEGAAQDQEGPEALVEALYGMVPRSVVQNAVGYLEQVCSCVAEGREPTDDDRQRARELLQFVGVMRPMLGIEDTPEPTMVEAEEPEQEEDE